MTKVEGHVRERGECLHLAGFWALCQHVCFLSQPQNWEARLCTMEYEDDAKFKIILCLTFCWFLCKERTREGWKMQSYLRALDG